MLDARALIEKHRSKGVLVDSNLLVLLLVGLVNKRRIPEFKRTQNFTIGDFDTLSALIGSFGKLVTTPHVLSQVSDLTDLGGNELATVRRYFGVLIEKVEEYYDMSTALVTDPLFARLGLTDAAIAKISTRAILVLTADLDLQLAIQRRGFDALNFNHVRALG